MSMIINLEGKTAAVTGSGRGLGKAMALELAKAGADVWVSCRTESEAQQTVKEIQALGRKSGYTVADVAKMADMQRMLDDAEKMGNGKLDILVNAAGVIDTDDLLDIGEEQIRRLIDINIIGTSNAIQAGLKKMIPHKAGKIITVSSIAGRQGMNMLEHYCMTKAAIINMTQSAALVAAPYHINVNGIAPGVIRTKMWEQILVGMTDNGTQEEKEKAWQESVKSLIPFGNAQTEEDIAYPVVFLCSDYAKEITGQTLNVDGGCRLN